MSETNTLPNLKFSRKARLEDFMDNVADKPAQNKYNNSQNNTDTIAKNQQEFGHKKRIKP